MNFATLAKTIKTKAQVNEEKILDKTEYENELKQKNLKIDNLTNENFKLLKHIKLLEANTGKASKKNLNLANNANQNAENFSQKNKTNKDPNDQIIPMDTDSYFSDEFKSTYEHIFSELEITKKLAKNYEEKIDIILKELENSQKNFDEMKQKNSELNDSNDLLCKELEKKDSELIKYKNDSDNLLLFELENQKKNNENLNIAYEEINLLKEKINIINDSLRKNYEIIEDKQKIINEEIFQKNQIILTVQKLEYDLENKTKFLNEQQDTIKNLHNSIAVKNEQIKEKEKLEREKNLEIEEFKIQIDEIRKKGTEMVSRFEDEIKNLKKEKDELLNEMSTVKIKLNQKVIQLRETEEQKNKVENNLIEIELKLANEENERNLLNEKIDKFEGFKSEMENEIEILKKENFVLCQNKNE